MRYRFKKIFSNRKILYLVFGVVLVSVFTLTVVYAALNAVLEITGSAEVSSADWDIRLENVKLISGSVGNSPVITHKDTVEFSFELSNPGEYYMFNVDVVNSGSIDAMIESIEKLPELTSEQTKYLNYIVEYQNGESINTKQLVQANSFVRLKVKVEYRKDLVPTDLPTDQTVLDLSFKVNYVQADDGVTSNVVNSGKLVRVVSGDYDTVGSEVCIGDECFYVISSTENDVIMLAKYNLLVGNKCISMNECMPLENPTGIQDESAKGYADDYPFIGTVQFSNLNYWYSEGLNDKYGISYPAYVYDLNSSVYSYIENYKKYLVNLGVSLDNVRLITYDELKNIGCSRESWSCSEAPSWVYSTTYWTGTAYDYEYVWYVNSFSGFNSYDFSSDSVVGIRPVIVMSKSEF